MNKKKVFGFSLIVVGVGLVISQPVFSFTGFSILSNLSSSAGSLLFFVGLGMMIVGAVLVTRKEELEEMFGKDTVPFKKEIKDIVPGKKGSSSENRKGVYEEIYRVVNGEHNKGDPHPYRAPATLDLGKQEIITRDADAVNDAAGVRGRGIYRHVYDKTGNTYFGLAKHLARNNTLGWVYRLKTPVSVKRGKED